MLSWKLPLSFQMLFAVILHTLYMQTTLSKIRKTYTEMPITFQDVKCKDYLFCSPSPPPPTPAYGGNDCRVHIIMKSYIWGIKETTKSCLQGRIDEIILVSDEINAKVQQEPYYIGLKTYYFKVWENGLSSKLKQEELISWFYLGDWVNNMRDQDIQAISGTPT